MGWRSPRESARIAPAVERPMPGSAVSCLDVRGNSPPCRVDQRLRAGVQMPRPRVVPEPGPQMQHLIERRRCEGVERGKARHEALEIRNHGRDLGLLQHHLGHPHPVGRRVFLPRQSSCGRAGRTRSAAARQSPAMSAAPRMGSSREIPGQIIAQAGENPADTSAKGRTPTPTIGSG